MLSDRFYPTRIDFLLKIIIHQFKSAGRLLGLPVSLIFRPSENDPFKTVRYGQTLETPIGVAAGPHTQLSQNIVAAWLAGARFIELKTIQTLDELEVQKPCIDMQDEGYNCEWSQELRIEQSLNQYVDAWILIHVLKDMLEIGNSKERGFSFNMSVGYNMKGILNANVQWFLTQMHDASEILYPKIESLASLYPAIRNLNISPHISDNVTLSTMHGCPPREIAEIGRYLIEKRHLHTSVKLNPTLLGKEEVESRLSKAGFSTLIPDIAFDHDPTFEQATKIIDTLQASASKYGLHFAVKLTNTLESVNNKNILPSTEKMMYMSGRALHPISVGVAHKLQQAFDGRLDISFCGGANAFNVSQLIGAGLSPITVCTDLLKPGGYGRLNQYLEELGKSFAKRQAATIEEFIAKTAGGNISDINKAALLNLGNYLEHIENDPSYRKDGFREPSIKTMRDLDWFDCAFAPCAETCPTRQDIPGYNFSTSKGDAEKAIEIICQTNPFARTTGMICDHTCQLKCTRINYEEAVRIRDIKRFAAEDAASQCSGHQSLSAPIGKRIAIIGAGPSGLSCAYFMAKAGFKADVFEETSFAGGMVAAGIPAFRLTKEAISEDISRIIAEGVNMKFNQKINKDAFESIRKAYEYVFIGTGAQRSAKLNIPGIGVAGVLDPLHFLKAFQKGETVSLGKKVIIVGGGNTAMDVARTVYRMVGAQGQVTIVYRRTIREMPADLGEIKAVLAEGITILELTSPVKVNHVNNRVSSIRCQRVHLGSTDGSGRPSPVAIPGSEFDIEADTLIPAVGQELDIDFCDPALLSTRMGSYETHIERVFIGGDALRGAATAIQAIGDGRKAAQEINDREKTGFNTRPSNTREPQTLEWHIKQRTRRMPGISPAETPLQDRRNFDLVTSALTAEQARCEARRCLLCDEFCNICATVCPNLALQSYEVTPVMIPTKKFFYRDSKWQVEPDTSLNLSQPYQILHIADWCNTCGNCNTFCPTAKAPYQEKPHIFISEKGFQEENEGFWLQKTGGPDKLHLKDNGEHHVIEIQNNSIIYTTGRLTVTFDTGTMQIKNYSISPGEGNEIRIDQFYRMWVVYQGIRLLTYW